MDKTTFIRKIDSMGRIVIPKDVRDLIKISSDDTLDFSVNNNSIIITKHSYNDSINVINSYVNCTKDLINGTVLTISRDRIIDNNVLIPKDIQTLINERKDYYSSSMKTYVFNEKSITGYYGIISFVKNSDVIGGVIIIKSNSFNNNDYLYINMLKRFVENTNYL